MFPIACDISVLSRIDLNNPRIEHVISLTTLEKKGLCPFLDLSLFLNQEIKMEKIPNNIGTTFVSKSENKFISTNEDVTDFFSDNYDLDIKMHVNEVLYKKVHVKSITKFSPKVVL